MPNWCQCDLTVSGPVRTVIDLLRYARGEHGWFDFGRFVPEPDAPTRPEPGRPAADLDWRVANWGTKWNARNTRHGRVTGQGEAAAVLVQFATAWTPPKPVIRRAVELFPVLTFDLRYFETGCCFCGRFCCARGGVIADETGDYTGPRGG